MDFKEIIQLVKNNYDIVDYVQMNGIPLQQSGKGTWKGLCPFHNENTPSFVISEDFQNYRCFGCHESGDIISFAQHIHTLELIEAVKMLADEKSIKIDFNNNSNKISHDINKIRSVVKDAHDFYRNNYKNLNESHPAKIEVKKRNLNINNDIYGYSPEAPNKLYQYLKSKGHSDKNIKDSNLVIFFDDNRQPWDFFHGRLMIVLSDYLGRPISFTSRKIFEDDKMKGKYVNGKESPVFLKKSTLFGADSAKRSARKEKKIYVVEGQFDRISMFENGIENVVATSGTAFTEDHANLLMRMVGDSGEIVFIMDGDEAGIEAATKIFTSFPILHSKSFAVSLEKGEDPCDYIIEKGIDSLKEKLKESIRLHDFVINKVLNELNNSINVNNRQQFVSEISRYAKHSNEKYIIDSMLSKASVISAVAIDHIREIYKKIDINKPQLKNIQEERKPDLQPKVNLNLNNEADKCMVTSLALLVRMPEDLIEMIPDMVHKKFRTFINEFKSNYEGYTKEDKKWRFIPEEYTDSDFVTILQNKEFLENPKENIDSSKSQFQYLFRRANEIYKKEYEEIRKAKALSSIVDSTDPKEIANFLRMYESQ